MKFSFPFSIEYKQQSNLRPLEAYLYFMFLVHFCRETSKLVTILTELWEEKKEDEKWEGRKKRRQFVLIFLVASNSDWKNRDIYN